MAQQKVQRGFLFFRMSAVPDDSFKPIFVNQINNFLEISLKNIRIV